MLFVEPSAACALRLIEQALPHSRSGQSVTAEMKNAAVRDTSSRRAVAEACTVTSRVPSCCCSPRSPASYIGVPTSRTVARPRSARRTELAVRGAMGASASRLSVSFLPKSAAGVRRRDPGVVLAYAGFASSRVRAARSVRLPSVAIDGQVLLFTLGLTIVTGLLFGLAPAWSARRVDPGIGSRARVEGRPIAAAVLACARGSRMRRPSSFCWRRAADEELHAISGVDRGFHGYTCSRHRSRSPPHDTRTLQRAAPSSTGCRAAARRADVESVAVTNVVLSGMIMTMPWKPARCRMSSPRDSRGRRRDGHSARLASRCSKAANARSVG